MIEKTYRFPSGSLILYSYSDFGEIVLYNNKKVVYKVYGEIGELEKIWDTIIQEIEQDFTEIIVKRLQEINTEKGV